METKGCSRCKKTKELSEFSEGRISCDSCLEKKREWRERIGKQKIMCPCCQISVNREGMARHEQSNGHIDKLRGRTRTNPMDKMVECMECKQWMTQRNYFRHLDSKKHYYMAKLFWDK